MIDQQGRVAHVWLEEITDPTQLVGHGVGHRRREQCLRRQATMPAVTDTVISGPYLLAALLALAAGAVSFASPCVIPLVPGYLAYLASLVGARGRRRGAGRRAGSGRIGASGSRSASGAGR